MPGPWDKYQPASSGGMVQISPGSPTLPLDIEGKQLDNAAKRRQLEIDAVNALAIAQAQRDKAIADAKTAQAAADERQRGKPLSDKAGEDLQTAVDAYSSLKQAVANFDDGYAGNLLGGAENALQSISSGIGTPGQKDWWSGFKMIDNQVRNSLFGASLAPGEKSAYAETTISPSDDPKIVRQNLQRRLEQANKALQRRVGRVRAGGFNADQIDATLGEVAPDTANGFKLPDYTKPQAKAAPAETSNPGGWQFNDERQATSMDGMPKLSPEDERFIAGAARYMTPQAMEQWFADRRMPLPKGNAQKVYDHYAADRGAANPAINYDEKAYRAQLEEANKRKGTPGYTDMFQSGFSASGTPMLAGLGGGTASLARGGSFHDGYVFNRDAQRLAMEQARERLGLPGAVAEGAGMVGGALALGQAGAAAFPKTAASMPSGLASLLTDAGFGMAYGANEAAPGQELGSAGIGALTAMTGNIAGQVGGKVAGGLASGITAPAARRLYQQGIKVTPGQAFRNRGGTMGRIVGGTEDALSSVPGVGDVLNARRVEGLEGANAAAFRIAGEPIGAVPTATGNEGLAQLGIAKDAAYSASVDPMRLTVDPQYQQGLDAARAYGRTAPGDMAAIAEAGIADSVDQFTPQSGIIPGENLQAIKQAIQKQRNTLKAAPGGQRASDALKMAMDNIIDMARRQEPEKYAGYARADKTHGRQKILEGAVKSASTRAGDPGMFTGAQLQQAINRSSNKYGPSGMEPLAQDMVRVLPSQIPDSGTARRVATQALGAGLGLGATGAAGYYLDPASAAIVAGSMLPFTKMGNRGLSALMLADRPDAIARIGESLKRASPMIGIGTAPLLLQER